MDNKIIIAIDAMGGENAPYKNIEGVSLYCKKNKQRDDFHFNLYGDKILIKKELDKHNVSTEIYSIFQSSTVVSDEETPLTAIKNSKDTSMWNCIKSQINGDSDISLSAGNTGVLLVISRMILKMMNEVSKPALAGLWPSHSGMHVVLDLGANIECNDQNLVDFAELGSALHKSLFPNKKTLVSLLNVGSEEIKGTEILKKSFKRLANLSNENNFIFNGYVEGNKIMSGDSNVIVTDGFTGNIALKTAEGTAKFITDNLKKSFMKNIFTKISLIFSYFPLKSFKEKLDPRKFNGAIFLGLKGPVVKSHGSTDSFGFYNSIDLCYKIIKGDLMTKLKTNLSHLNIKNVQK